MFGWLRRKENKWWSSDIFSPGQPKIFLSKIERTKRKKLMKWASQNTLKIYLQISNVLALYFFPFIFFFLCYWHVDFFSFFLDFFSLLLTWWFYFFIFFLLFFCLNVASFLFLFLFSLTFSGGVVFFLSLFIYFCAHMFIFSLVLVFFFLFSFFFENILLCFFFLYIL